MAKKALREAALKGPIDVACVFHGTGYDWSYVDRLYNMVVKNIDREVRFHVYTEAHRFVPSHMHKHVLEDWPGVGGPKKSWWYKMQLFNCQHVSGRLLYFDLDIVIIKDLNWLLDLELKYFWAIHDFRHLWRPSWQGINSSLMLWDTNRYSWIWDDFKSKNINATIKLFHGDQDYLNSVLPQKYRKFIDPDLIKSWRWQVKDGGMDFRTRVYKHPDAGSMLDPLTRVLIFHGSPKPHEVQDPVIDHYWTKA